MRQSTVLLILTTMACGSSNDAANSNTPLLPADALSVAWYGVPRPTASVIDLSLDPSIEADLAVYEDDGCYQDSTSPSPLQPNQTTYSLTRNYINCSQGVFSATTGSRVVAVNVVDGSHTTLDSNFSLQLDQSSSSLNLTSTTTVALDGNAASGTMQRNIASQGTWTDVAAGTTQTFTNTLNFTDTYDASTQLPTQTVLTGNYASGYSGSVQGYQVTYSNLILQPAVCCVPVGGSIVETQTFSDASTQTDTWVFTSTCGAFTVDGDAFSIVQCP